MHGNIGKSSKEKKEKKDHSSKVFWNADNGEGATRQAKQFRLLKLFVV